jgi:hypothetical protein
VGQGSLTPKANRPVSQRHALSGVGSGHDEAGLVGENDGLDAVAKTKFVEDAGDVGLKGSARRRLDPVCQVGGLGVAAAGDQVRDLDGLLPLLRNHAAQLRGGQ